MTAAPALAGMRPIPGRPPVQVLHPGDLVHGDRGARFETLLGSCVAIILADPRRTFATMCHIVHSRAPLRGEPASGAYAGVALAAMYGRLRAHGMNPMLCEAWVFGGGNMFPALVQQGHVGDDNVRWAFEALGADGLRIVASDVGGRAYRRVAWSVGAGDPEVATVQV